MNEMNRAKSRGSSLAIWVLALTGIALAAGAFYWVKNSAADVAPQAPPAVVRGSSFYMPSQPPAKVATPETPKPVELPAPVPKADVKPVEPPAPKPVDEIKPAPLAPPVEVPVPAKPAEAKPEAKPAETKVAEPTPAEAKPAEPKVAEAKPAEPKPAEVKPAPEDDKPVSMTFAKLAFRYWPQPKGAGGKDPFPAPIKALNGKKITIDGYMFPIDFEKGKVRSFLLSRAMFGCCYGDSPQITEVIKVMRTDGKLMPFEAMARVTGTLEVGEEFDGEGYIDSVYRLKADTVGPSPGGR